MIGFVLLIGTTATPGVTCLKTLGSAQLSAHHCVADVLNQHTVIGPNAGALASGEVPDHPGTGSAVLGFLQWCTAGVIAPIAGLGGERTAVPMALIVLTLVTISFAALALASPRYRPAAS